MKKLLTALFFVLSLNSCETKDPSLIEYLFSASNPQMIALEFNATDATCPKCRMNVEHKENSAQVVFNDEKTYIFDDVGCLILWIEQIGVDIKSIKSFVYAKDTHQWIDAQKAFYSIKDATPMGYGFGGYEKNQTEFIDFDTMRLKMLRGENMADPKIRKMLLGQ
ncbi:MAG: hypothetical protein JXQ76_08550 [Campylobacterales bacterium]|nr:hypothetical protein [Campylobacterales bacterium]